jgi:phosphoglycerate dehydrogenase-like enzyme
MEYRFLTYGRLSEEFQLFVQDKYPSLDVIRADTKEEIISALPKVNAIAGFNFLSDEDLSSIEWIHAFGAGVDSYVKLDGLNSNTILTRTSGDLPIKMGEYCLAYVLHDLQSISSIEANQRSHIWKQYPTQNLHDLNVLILGTGTIGQGIARQFQRASNRVIGLNRNRLKKAGFDEIIDWNDLNKELEIDIIINTLPSTNETDSLLDESFFHHFNRTLFINVGRGKTIHNESLLKALHDDQVRKAILDVFDVEPLPGDSPFWQHDRIIVSPHQSGITTIDDVSSSFELIYEAIENGETNHLFVDLEKAY